MRVLDCECGTTIKAANDAELAAAVKDHLQSDHPERGSNEDDARALVAARAYEASDA